MNLANRLTLLRVFMAIGFACLFYLPGTWFKLAAGLLFGAAAYTDLLDGRIARQRKQVTDFGRVMDPVADKLLVCVPLILFVEARLVPAWMVLVILGREFAISGLRIVAAGKGLIISASKTGKHKTASQITAIIVILTIIFVRSLVAAIYGSETAALSALGVRPTVWFPLINDLPYLVMLVAVFFSLFSGIDYFWRNRHIFQGEF